MKMPGGQTQAERLALDAAWRSHPKVVAFYQAAIDYAREQDLPYTVAGMNQMSRWTDDWITQHGPLPPSGIRIG